MKKLINDGWTFAKLPEGSTAADAEKAVFEPVDIPHDWLIWQENDLYESADAWYMRDLELPEDHDPVVMIRFDGVYMDCDVLLNGQTVCTHPYGYTAFDAPLTGKLKEGKNRLAVHIRHKSPNSRWYSGSGIYRDVTLVTLPENHLVPDSLYLKETYDGGIWTVRVSAETEGGTDQPFTCRILEQDGKLIASAEGKCSAGKAEAVLQTGKARAWSPEDPYLYLLEIKYGKQTEVRKIGLRSLSAEPGTGMTLNGNPLRLKGVCLHHDLGCLGAAFHEKAAARQLRLMKEMGANAVRTSHNPPASKFLDLCDEMGMLVVDEAFDMWERPKTEYDYARFFPAWHDKDVASWIRRDRCHPCVIMWSIGNEIYDMHADERGAEITRILAESVRTHDPDRHAYTTFGCNYMPWSGGQKCAEYVDIVGYNYGEKLYEAHHKSHPGWIIYGSETGSVLSSRGIYHFPVEQSIMSDEDRQCSALGNSNTSWGAESMREIIEKDLQQSVSLGQFLWSGTDYIGEPTPYHTRSCYFGQTDTAGFPKDSYRLIQSCWTDRKAIHIGVSWDWNRGQLIDIPVMTRCCEAELFLNGVSLGRKRTKEISGTKFPPVWKQAYIPGELRAVGYDENGEPVCEDRRHTPGETASLKMKCEDEFLLSDGWDITFVAVTAEDNENHPVENARDRVRITVSGGGRLIGTDNGDPTDTDGYKSDSRRLFSGRLLLVIGSSGKQEDADILLERKGHPACKMTIPVRCCPKIPGVSCFQRAARRPAPDRIPARKIEIEALGPTALTKECSDCSFRYRILPGNASDYQVKWQVTNTAGIEAPHIRLTEDRDTVTVHASADGSYYLRALCLEDGNCAFISQIEFSATGLDTPALDPYQYICAGLYDLHEGEIGCGNEKGIATARDGESMIGFRNVDFGKTGTDTVSADIFALDGRPYDLELTAGEPDGEERTVSVLRYRKPCIWNTYQRETWKLPERLTGLRTLRFRMRDKVHIRGFVFEKQNGAWLTHFAADADSLYGDSFRTEGKTVSGIGNNVTLTWKDMDFEGAGQVILEIRGSTTLPLNTVSVLIRNEKGDERKQAADFSGTKGNVQRFFIEVPDGLCTVSFVFLPGSQFDFNSFRFYREENWTDRSE